jgi:hypothetical protein
VALLVALLITNVLLNSLTLDLHGHSS